MKTYLTAVLLACTVQAWAGTATINIDTTRTGPKLNPSMYGIFLEEINHGVDGGLYAELIANRAFEDSRPPEGFTLQDGRYKDEKGYESGFEVRPGAVPRWSLIREGEAKGRIQIESTGGLNENTPYCLRLDVEELASGRVGIANSGFWGIGLTKKAKYDLVLHARAAEPFRGSVSVGLENDEGAACSQVKRFTGISPTWKRFETTLTATMAEPKARLVIAADAPGTVWLDFVSLFPRKTFKNRPNGLHRDIAQMIADLKPGFVRFPGGCVVEGGTVETAYNWKLTVGPVEQRPERWNAWGYRRTHGMGFHEYLQFCEDLGAEPMHVGFAGQTCLYRHAEHVPMEEMDWVVAGFTDAIEYANGAVDSKWGRLRAQAGHREPFEIRLVEIGNENGMQQYEDRYKLIHSAVKKAYPDLTYIADYAIPGGQFDMVDHHFYNHPQWFLSQFDYYDRYDRSAAPVYVGEIAVTSDEGGDLKGNLIAALAEGVFLMGCERNADVVKMVSYAPLLAHVNGRSGWHGMIYHDSTRVFGTVSYHLWKLFGANRPDFTLKIDVKFSSLRKASITGGIGLGTWDTAAEFKDVRVEKDGEILYGSDFSKGVEGWTTEGGTWSVVDGAYRQSDRVVGLSYFGDQTWSDYTLTLKARKLSGAEGFLIVFGHKDSNKYWWNVGGWGNRDNGIEFNRTPVGPHVSGHIETDRWYDIKVELKERKIRCYLDDKLVHEETGVGTERFFASAGQCEATGDLIVKVINTSPEDVTTAIKLDGIDRLRSKAELTILKSDSLEDNNSLDNPAKVVPLTRTITGIDTDFTHTFPAYSPTVMRLKE